MDLDNIFYGRLPWVILRMIFDEFLWWPLVSVSPDRGPLPANWPLGRLFIHPGTTLGRLGRFVRRRGMAHGVFSDERDVMVADQQIISFGTFDVVNKMRLGPPKTPMLLLTSYASRRAYFVSYRDHAANLHAKGKGKGKGK
jgi:hypothetical protein